MKPPSMRMIAALASRPRAYQVAAFGLSLSAHIAVGLLLHTGGPWRVGALASRPMSSPLITVRLSSNQTHSAAPALALQAVAFDAMQQPIADALDPMAGAPAPESWLTIATDSGPHYFRSAELSAKPFMLEDILSRVGLAFLDVPPQTVAVRLLINEHGAVDRVMPEDSGLPEQAERFLIDAFSSIKFSPGKIGDIQVKSQLKIEIAIDNVVPAPAAKPASDTAD